VMSWPCNTPDSFRNSGVPQYVRAVGGGVHRNPDYDDGNDVHPPRMSPPAPIKRDAYDDDGLWVCSACGHMHAYERLCHYGDEAVTWCEDCGSFETLENKGEK